MSIILKGIDLPETNEIRMIAINSNGEVFFNTVKDGTPDKTKISQAIQIPKGHGRLIDGDELISDLRIYESKYCGEQGYITQDDIIDAPTILEAEE